MTAQDEMETGKEPIDAVFETEALDNLDNASGPEPSPQKARTRWARLAFNLIILVSLGGLIAYGVWNYQKAEQENAALQAQLSSLTETLTTGLTEQRAELDVLAAQTARLDLFSEKLSALEATQSNSPPIFEGDDNLQFTAILPRLEALESVLDVTVENDQAYSVTLADLGERIGMKASEISDLEQIVRGVETRLAALEGQGEALSNTDRQSIDAALQVLTERVDALQVRQAETMPRSEEMPTRAADMGEDNTDGVIIETDRPEGPLLAEDNDLEAEPSTASAEAPLFQARVQPDQAALALISIERAAEQGMPFREDFETLKSAMPEASDIQILVTTASVGINTIAELQRAFDMAYTEARMTLDDRQRLKPQQNWAWLDRLFGGQVEVRRRNPDFDQLIAGLETAQAAIEDQSLALAIEILSELEDKEMNNSFAPWLETARQHLELKAALTALRADLLQAEESLENL
mgnify:CR=1 FL=1